MRRHVQHIFILSFSKRCVRRERKRESDSGTRFFNRGHVSVCARRVRKIATNERTDVFVNSICYLWRCTGNCTYMDTWNAFNYRDIDVRCKLSYHPYLRFAYIYFFRNSPSNSYIRFTPGIM